MEFTDPIAIAIKEALTSQYQNDKAILDLIQRLIDRVVAQDARIDALELSCQYLQHQIDDLTGRYRLLPSDPA
jgi:hypothetical protein